MKKRFYFVLKVCTVLFAILMFSACSAKTEKNHILITHSDQEKPSRFPADVEYHYVIEEGYRLPHENMMVTFKWHPNGTYKRMHWMYEVKKNNDGYSVLNTEHEGFYVDDITKFGYSPVSELSGRKGTFVVTVNNEAQYESVIGNHPNEAGIHHFEEILRRR